MTICFLTPRFPFPECGGDVLRINNIARYFKSQGNRLVLVSLYEDGADFDAARQLYDAIYCVKRHNITSAFYSLLFFMKGMPIQCGYYYSRKYKKLFMEVADKEKPDRYIVHLLRMVPYINEQKIPFTTVEMTDALSKTYSLSRRSKGFSVKKFMYKIERSHIAKYEISVSEKFPKVVLVSDGDIDYLRTTSKKELKSLELHTNGIDCSSEIKTNYDQNKICFIGNMVSLQNQDAVLNFYYNIFPKILEKNNNAKFYIIGNKPPHRIKRLASMNANVIVTGYVDDLYETAGDSCLAVAPVNIAAGIQNKVLVSMSMGIPVIMSSLISKAIPGLKNGENCIIEDNTTLFAENCIEIMNNPSLRNYLSARGRMMVERHYSWYDKLKGY